MVEYQIFIESSSVQTIVAVLGSCVFCMVLFLCTGSKHKSKNSVKKEGEKNINKVADTTVDITNDVHITVISPSVQQEFKASLDLEPKPEFSASHQRALSYDLQTTNFDKYVPPEKKSASLPNEKTEHSYARVKRIGKDKFDMIEDSGNSVKYSTSGSGNSESGNYARVKKLEKEEVAYSVVEIKEPSKTYDMINGDIVKLPGMEYDNENEPDIQDKPTQRTFSDKTLENDVAALEVVENSGNSGYYASVNNEGTKVQSDQQGGGLYESCGPVSRDTSQESNFIISSSSASKPDDTYELLEDKSSSSANNTYDFIPSSSTNEVIELTKKRSKSKSKKEKNEKKDKAPKTDKHLKENNKKGDGSPSQSKLTRGIFSKLSKKNRKSDGNISTEEQSTNTDVRQRKQTEPPSLSENRLSWTASHPPPVQRITDLPLATKQIPPPLPSVDKLKHLTEHMKARRLSQDGLSSAETSPRTSPRAAIDSINIRSCSMKDAHFSIPCTEDTTISNSTYEDISCSKISSDLQILAKDAHCDKVMNSFEHEKTVNEEDKYSSIDAETKQKIVERNDVIRKQSSIEGWKRVSVASDSSDGVMHFEEFSPQVSDGPERIVEPDYACVDFNKKQKERKALELYAVVDKSNVGLNLSRRNSGSSTDGIDNATYEGSYSLIQDFRIETHEEKDVNPPPIYDDYEFLTPNTASRNSLSLV